MEVNKEKPLIIVVGGLSDHVEMIQLALLTQEIDSIRVFSPADAIEIVEQHYPDVDKDLLDFGVLTKPEPVALKLEPMDRYLVPDPLHDKVRSCPTMRQQCNNKRRFK